MARGNVYVRIMHNAKNFRDPSSPVDKTRFQLIPLVSLKSVCHTICLHYGARTRQTTEEEKNITSQCSTARPQLRIKPVRANDHARDTRVSMLRDAERLFPNLTSFPASHAAAICAKSLINRIERRRTHRAIFRIATVSVLPNAN